MPNKKRQRAYLRVLKAQKESEAKAKLSSSVAFYEKNTRPGGIYDFDIRIALDESIKNMEETKDVGIMVAKDGRNFKSLADWKKEHATPETADVI